MSLRASWWSARMSGHNSRTSRRLWPCCGPVSTRWSSSVHAEEITQTRRAQVGGAERAEKIRTYNFPQDRVTDHRISSTYHGLEQILDGDLDDIMDALMAWEQGVLLEKVLA